MAKRLYFGHPINAYGTTLESTLLARIGQAFPGWEIENPNQAKHDAGYALYRERTGKGMDYYEIEVLPACDGGVFLPFRDGAWGAGVHLEAVSLVRQGKPVWEIAPDGAVRYADLANARVLTVDETRARVRGEGGRVLPF